MPCPELVRSLYHLSNVFEEEPKCCTFPLFLSFLCTAPNPINGKKSVSIKTFFLENLTSWCNFSLTSEQLESFPEAGGTAAINMFDEAQFVRVLFLFSIIGQDLVPKQTC